MRQCLRLMINCVTLAWQIRICWDLCQISQSSIDDGLFSAFTIDTQQVRGYIICALVTGSSRIEQQLHLLGSLALLLNVSTAYHNVDYRLLVLVCCGRPGPGAPPTGD